MPTANGDERNAGVSVVGRDWFFVAKVILVGVLAVLVGLGFRSSPVSQQSDASDVAAQLATVSQLIRDQTEIAQKLLSTAVVNSRDTKQTNADILNQLKTLTTLVRTLTENSAMTSEMLKTLDVRLKTLSTSLNRTSTAGVSPSMDFNLTDIMNKYFHLIEKIVKPQTSDTGTETPDYSQYASLLQNMMGRTAGTGGLDYANLYSSLLRSMMGNTGVSSSADVAETGLLSTSGKPINSLALLDGRLYTLRNSATAIEIYDLATLKLLRLHDVVSLKSANSLAACERHSLLYIADSSLKVIFRLTVQMDGKIVNQYFQVTDSPTGLSVNSEANLLVTFQQAGIIGEYTRSGTLVRQIVLQKNIASPFHAIEIWDGEYAVAHGGDRDPVRRVCLVNRSGKISVSFGGTKGELPSQKQLPIYTSLALLPDDSILVTDIINNLVIRLDADLSYKSTVANAIDGLEGPMQVVYDADTERVLVADDTWDVNGKRVSGRVRTFKLSID